MRPDQRGQELLGLRLRPERVQARPPRPLPTRVSRLLDELALARAEGTCARLLARLAKVDVLILDDWGLGSLKEARRHDPLEVLEDRYGRVSTIVTSQLPIAKWHEWIGDPSLADAILDRLVNNAYKLDLKGNSRRRDNPVNTNRTADTPRGRSCSRWAETGVHDGPRRCSRWAKPASRRSSSG